MTALRHTRPPLFNPPFGRKPLFSTAFRRAAGAFTQKVW
jgi:hypothetical protein